MVKTLAKSANPSFRIGLLMLLILSLALRFWGLGRFNMLVFDEVYYAKFANNYLTQTPFFDGHPPLSKYLIALGIWLGNRLPIGQDTVNTLTGSTLSTFSYRWLNALLGSLIPVIVAGIAYQISQRRSIALLAGYFTALDGLLLVESRYALNNVHLLLFGLLGHLCLLFALNPTRHNRLPWLILSGINFGCSIAIKWNGLWFLLGAYAIWGIAWIVKGVARLAVSRRRSPSPEELNIDNRGMLGDSGESPELSPLQRLSELHIVTVALYLGVLPIVVYSLWWIPHIILNPEYNFIEVHQQILSYHQRIGGMTPYADPNCTPWHQAFFTRRLTIPLCVPEIHPYCSPWWTWIIMLRPVVYLYETARTVAEVVPVNPPPPYEEAKVVYDVHAIGNPVLWWASSIAILLVVWQLGQRLYRQVLPQPREVGTENATAVYPSTEALLLAPQTISATDRHRVDQSIESRGNWQLTPSTWAIVYILTNYGANLLPWVRVTRCSFLYHYMGAGIFATLALAWCCDRWLQRDHASRINTLSLLGLIILAFLFWLPIYLGLPLSSEGVQIRRLLPTW
jgi:dolichyl-phosphate-mannose--protein O-mannosyl transferase